ncbi:MAG: hypothetical protein E7596_05925 [Ruminococcaceae bacterium]|nr:hypothetical protein [Oscillospiraceae bacterium]
MKNYFKKYVSNTLASTQNQLYFISDGTKQKGRVYLKAFSSGLYEYSFLFEDSIDSTYADGSVSKVNETCGGWTIHSAKLLICENDYAGDLYEKIEPKKAVELTFNGKKEKQVNAGEIFCSDPVSINIDKSEDWYLEIEFSGSKIPYFEEIVVPTKRFVDGEWVTDKKVPVPSMVGVARQVEKKIAFLGDSITEGIGTDCGSYEHWNAKIAEIIGEKYSYWNLGIGFARAADAASNGAWLNKAKQMDVVTICLGVNDMGSGYSATEIKCNLESIVRILQDNKVRTILFTVPPFDYQGDEIEKWKSINSYILNNLSKITEVYDVVPVWGDKAPNVQHAIYGGHPNAQGCLALALDFIEKIKL